ncbi:MAG: 2-oxoacid:acceptor oxidoreductase family protein [Deltaproteobacteria bacterium]|jgi:pyruvate ferredoxin oxidoreductase gamma subunit|nr:2-oxoacid:acceptor oxidoreductase family protein [Deltaproteobacteria bacterium]
MLEIRFHGRGGQGSVTSTELMAQTAIGMGKYAQAFPSFGPERRGAPVTAFLRISDKPIRIREKVYRPNVVVVLDPTVMSVTKVDQGLDPDGILLINTTHSIELLRKQFGFKQKIATIDAMTIALEVLKVPITNTIMLGAFSKILNQATLEDVKEPFNHRFGPSLAPKNLEAFKRAYDEAHLEGSV